MDKFIEHEKIKVSGKIFKEVSEKLPNMKIALNELLKNSYDACASEVKVIFSIENNTLVIEDNGTGMDRNDISTLLSISESVKSYGTKNECGRLTQGSKGLGFLSAFKFGQEVEWETVKDNKRITLKLDMNFLEQQKNISEPQIPLNIETLDKSECLSYTKISINLNEETSKEFKEVFIDQSSNTEKILNSFSDNDFIIRLFFNNEPEMVTNKAKEINQNLKDSVLYEINYLNEHGKIRFKHNDIELFDVNFPNKSEKFKVNANLKVYHLKGKSIKDADSMFLFNSSHKDIMAPIVYINDNIFFSHELFDPEITRSLKTSIVLPQISGFINVYSSNKDLEFNAERTRLVENEFSEELKQFLYNLNLTIQTEGSKNKTGLIDYKSIINNNPDKLDPLDGDSYEKNILKIKSFSINDKFPHSKFVETKIENDEIEFIFTNKSLGKYKLPKLKKDIISPVEIILKKDFETFPISHGQINLRDNLVSATNSKNINVYNEIDIFINGEKKDILESITREQEVNVIYSYNDQHTGNATKNMIIKFIDSTYKQGKLSQENPPLIAELGKKGYYISISYHTNKLVEEINKLYLYSQENYINIIATSLRAVFDLCIQQIIKANIKADKIKNTNSLEINVNKTIELLSKDIRNEIAKNSGLTEDYIKNQVLENEGQTFTKRFGNASKLSNLGSHFSGEHLSTKDIEDISKKLSFFLIVCNELLNNNVINSLL